MKYKRDDIRLLIETLVDATRKDGGDLTTEGYKVMAELLTERTKIPFNEKYLKYTLYDGGFGKRGPHLTRLDAIAKFVGHRNYRAFLESLNLDSGLQSLIGEYYCFVRMNQEKGELLRSPVKIFPKDGRISYYLKGSRLHYEGELKKSEGCLFVLMKSIKGDKSFYHVYRIGAMDKPEVLQGIFSGVSTNFNPIGGRAVLVRANESFENLKIGRLDVKTLRRSKQVIEQNLALYFEKMEENNLSISTPSTFDRRDLTRRAKLH